MPPWGDSAETKETAAPPTWDPVEDNPFDDDLGSDEEQLSTLQMRELSRAMKREGSTIASSPKPEEEQHSWSLPDTHTVYKFMYDAGVLVVAMSFVYYMIPAADMLLPILFPWMHHNNRVSGLETRVDQLENWRERARQ